MGDFGAAAVAQEKALRIKGDGITASDVSDYGELLVLAAGGYVSPEAETAFRAALARDETDERARYYVGLMMVQTGRPDIAFRLWDALLRRGPEDAPWIAPILAQIKDVSFLAGVDYTLPSIGAGAARGPTIEDMEAASDMTAEEAHGNDWWHGCRDFGPSNIPKCIKPYDIRQHFGTYMLSKVRVASHSSCAELRAEIGDHAPLLRGCGIGGPWRNSVQQVTVQQYRRAGFCNDGLWLDGLKYLAAGGLVTIGQHRMHRVFGAGVTALSEYAPVRSTQNIGGLVIGGPPDHHTVKAAIQQRLGLIQRGDAAVDRNMQAKGNGDTTLTGQKSSICRVRQKILDRRTGFRPRYCTGVYRDLHRSCQTGGYSMKSHYRAVVIGGGVVGASVLYHLAKFGWKDVCLIERSVLTAGSSWHAAGGIHALNADPNIAGLQAYTIDLLSEIEEESGQNIGLHMTGGMTLAGTPDRWEWLQSAYRTFQSIGIDDCRLITPKEAGELCPIMSTDGILGGMWADREGYVDTTGTVHAYAGAAKKHGATVIENNRVLELNQTADGWEVVTEKGTIHTEHVVNAAGLWAKQVGRMAGVELPVSPLNHHYLISDTIPELEKIDFEVPMTVDLEGFTYMRQDQKGILLGIYEVDHEHWMMDGAPWEYGFELQQEDTDRIENELTLGFERYPALQEVGVKTWVNGAFTFSPDGNPLVGPVRGKRGYWCACAVMAGFLQGGGVGKSLAEWMIHGEPEADVFGMDVARYGDYAQNKRFIKETTGQFYTRRFVMTYPNEQLPAGRALKTAPAYSDMSAANCRWGASYGLEMPLYFAPSPEFEGTADAQTLKRI
ncbi:Dimethylglycine dehydrogenase, mitochondrial [Nymphon striatum]|nr:Dimethylglycine dehydrogenase, mitochondrial [Nymphon striatum]